MSDDRDRKEPTILYIEDNPGNLLLVQEIVEIKTSWTLLSAATAEAGIDIARDAQPDLILMDINLPGMNGCEASALLRADPGTSDIPILAVTATPDPCEGTNEPHSLFAGLIKKPFTIKEFITRTQAALNE